jgi:ABC-type glycerol-3-phosphate transport system permease component
MSITTVKSRENITKIHPSARRFRLPRDLSINLILGLLGFVTFVPVLMLLQLSLKGEQQMANSMWLPQFPLHFENYLTAYSQMIIPMINSLIYVGGTVSVSIICSTVSAYIFARYNFPGKKFLFLAILSLMMIPGILTLLPRFSVVLSLKLNNTFYGVWLPLAAAEQAFQIIILRTFFETTSEELFEAARIDGASEMRMLLSIALPLAMPMLTTLVVLHCNSVWNEYVWPMMILSNPKLYPVMLTILSFNRQLLGISNPGATFAGFVMAGIPLLLLFSLSSRSFIQGLTSGAVKM